MVMNKESTGNQAGEMDTTALLEMLAGLEQLETQLAQLAGNTRATILTAQRSADPVDDQDEDDTKQADSAMELYKSVKEEIQKLKKGLVKKPVKSIIAATPVLEGMQHARLSPRPSVITFSLCPSFLLPLSPVFKVEILGSVTHRDKMGVYTCVGTYGKRPLYKHTNDFFLYRCKKQGGHGTWYIGSIVGMSTEKKRMYDEIRGSEVQWTDALFLKLERGGAAISPVDAGKGSHWQEYGQHKYDKVNKAITCRSKS
jgi:hypothetical protein